MPFRYQLGRDEGLITMPLVGTIILIEWWMLVFDAWDRENRMRSESFDANREVFHEASIS